MPYWNTSTRGPLDMTLSIMPSNLDRASRSTGSRNAAGVAEKRDGLAIAAQLLGYTRGTLKVEVYGGTRRTAINILETVIREAVRNGQPDVAQGILHRLSAAAAEVMPVQLGADLLIQEAELDGADEPAQTAYALDPSPITWDTLRRRWMRYRAVLDQAIAAGDTQWGRS